MTAPVFRQNEPLQITDLHTRVKNLEAMVAGGATGPTGPSGGVVFDGRYSTYESGSPVTVLENDNGVMTWDTLTSDDALLDISDVEIPLVVEEGLYAFSISVYATQVGGGHLTPGGKVVFIFQIFPPDETYILCQVTSGFVTGLVADGESTGGTLNASAYCPAGSIIHLYVWNRDTVFDIEAFLGYTVVQKCL